MHRPFTLNDILCESYYKFPRYLDFNIYNNLQPSSKMLYMYMLDRHKLSICNKWYDENNDVFIFFSRAEMMEKMKIKSKTTIIRLVDELKCVGLIKELRQGNKKANRIYVQQPSEELLISMMNSDKYIFDCECGSKNEPHTYNSEVQKMNPSNNKASLRPSSKNKSFYSGNPSDCPRDFKQSIIDKYGEEVTRTIYNVLLNYAVENCEEKYNTGQLYWFVDNMIKNMKETHIIEEDSNGEFICFAVEHIIKEASVNQHIKCKELQSITSPGSVKFLSQFENGYSISGVIKGTYDKLF